MDELLATLEQEVDESAAGGDTSNSDLSEKEDTTELDAQQQLNKTSLVRARTVYKINIYIKMFVQYSQQEKSDRLKYGCYSLYINWF